MATVLENYTALRSQAGALVFQGGAKSTTVWLFGEVTYRIGVLETCQMFMKTAPETTDTQALQKHYLMLDAFVQNLAQERRYGPDRGPDTQKERDASQLNLGRVIQDYRKRFSSFQPSNPKSYCYEIDRLVTTLLPAWLQFRETFVPIRIKEESAS